MATIEEKQKLINSLNDNEEFTLTAYPLFRVLLSKNDIQHMLDKNALGWVSVKHNTVTHNSHQHCILHDIFKMVVCKKASGEYSANYDCKTYSIEAHL